MNGAKVLVIEDLWERYKELKRALRGEKIELVWAETESEARKWMGQHSNAAGRLQVDTVVVNAYLGNHQIATSLINNILAACPGEIIGISEEESFRIRLKRAGCHHVCDYDSLPQMLLHVLGLS